MKAYLLDTNVISEIMTTEPNQRVIDFLAQIKESYLSAITLHELHYGLQLFARRTTAQHNSQQITKPAHSL